MKKAFYILLGLFAAATLSYALWITDTPPVAPIVVNHAVKPAAKAAIAAPDPRLAPLEAFLAKYHCVDADQATYYLFVADSYNLDWRLLPALSFKEESCTKNASKFNLWGWDSGAKAFTDFQQGILFISDKLANSHYYAGKTTRQKLQVYGPKSSPGYADSVLKIMDSIFKEE